MNLSAMNLSVGGSTVIAGVTPWNTTQCATNICPNLALRSDGIFFCTECASNLSSLGRGRAVRGTCSCGCTCTVLAFGRLLTTSKGDLLCEYAGKGQCTFANAASPGSYEIGPSGEIIHDNGSRMFIGEEEGNACCHSTAHARLCGLHLVILYTPVPKPEPKRPPMSKAQLKAQRSTNLKAARDARAANAAPY